MRTSSFKTYGRGQRALTTEQTFVGGMLYTDTPLPESACKALINFDFKDNGAVLVPRGGYRVVESNIGGLKQNLFKLKVHHIGQAIVSIAPFIDEQHRYILFTEESADAVAFNYDNMQILLEDQATQYAPTLTPIVLKKADEATYEILTKVNTKYFQIHNMPFKRTAGLPIVCHLNGVPYFPIQYTLNAVTTTGIGKITFRKGTVEQDGTDSIIATIAKVDPKDITPNQAVNYGYNMLHPTPYTFADQLSEALSAGQIILHGVLPYADANCIIPMFNAKVGQPVTFRLFASFPDEESIYKFRWEIRDLQSETAAIVFDQESADAIAYHYSTEDKSAVGDDNYQYITCSFQPPFKEFSITVTAFASTDLTEPLQVMALASYHLTKDTPGSTASIEVKNYDLSTAKGMCLWEQRLVLWGIQSGGQILFVSDPNDPTYFPYPNNVEVFNEDIIHVIPYLTGLLVFTETRLYKLSWSPDGLSYTKTVVQERLMLSDFDATTVCVVKNMVYFKNGNYFYMVVPTADDTAGALQLAPISRPITNLLDNFEREIMDIILTMYNPERVDRPMPDEHYALNLQVYHNYMDNNAMRNVYKFNLDIAAADNTVRHTVTTFDFVLNYDSLLRVWSAYIIESNLTRMLPYRQNVTDTTLYINLTHESIIDTDEESNTYNELVFIPTLELLKVFPLIQHDAFKLDVGLVEQGRRFKNWQFIDTGYRDHDQQIKKRYREIQFKINNVSQQSLEFGTEFMIDDDMRKNLFKYSAGQLDVDSSSPYFGWVYIDREYDNPVVAVGAAMLEDEDDPAQPYPTDPILTSGDVLYSNRWVLDYSPLARVASTKVRFPVSGKGYCPRLKMLSFNEQLYELLLFAYVYRNMFAR